MYGNQGNHRPHRGRFRWEHLALAVVCTALVIVGGVKLFGYIGELISAITASGELRQVYYSEPTTVPAAATEAPSPLLYCPRWLLLRLPRQRLPSPMFHRWIRCPIPAT